MKIRTFVRFATLFVLLANLPAHPQSTNKVVHGAIIKVNGARVQPCHSD
jgi:hypothetical protein